MAESTNGDLVLPIMRACTSGKRVHSCRDDLDDRRILQPSSLRKGASRRKVESSGKLQRFSCEGEFLVWWERGPVERDLSRAIEVRQIYNNVGSCG